MRLGAASGSPQVPLPLSGDGRWPRGGDGRAPVAVARGAYRCRVEQDRLPVTGPPASAAVPAAEVLPGAPAVFAAQPAENLAPGEGAQVAEGGAGHAGAEMVAPAAHDSVEPVQQDLQGQVDVLTAQVPDLPGDRGDRLLRRVGIDVVPVRALLPAALDVPAEEVQALVDVGDQRLSGDRRRPIVVRTPAISARSASASSRVPDTTRHQSSAYLISR